MIRYSSLATVVISAGILLSYMTGMFAISFVLTLILAAQSAVYSPAKYSIITSIVGTENIRYGKWCHSSAYYCGHSI